MTHFKNSKRQQWDILFADDFLLFYFIFLEPFRNFLTGKWQERLRKVGRHSHKNLSLYLRILWYCASQVWLNLTFIDRKNTRIYANSTEYKSLGTRTSTRSFAKIAANSFPLIAFRCISMYRTLSTLAIALRSWDHLHFTEVFISQPLSP